MNQSDLVRLVCDSTGLAAKDAKAAVDAAIDRIAGALAAGASVRTGLGTFTPVDRPARPGRNPSTGERLTIPASRAVRFKASKTLKDRVNGPAR